MRHFGSLYAQIALSLCLAGAPAGCASAEAERSVGVSLQGPGDVSVECMSMRERGVIAELIAEKAEEAGEKTYDLLLMPGDLLAIKLRERGGEKRSVREFQYVFGGDEKTPLAFGLADHGATLNGTLAFVDFTEKAAVEWLHGLAWEGGLPEAVAHVRSIRLPAGVADAREVLGRFAGRDVFVQLPQPAGGTTTQPAVPPTLAEPVAQALVAARPAGLFAPHMGAVEGVLGKLKGLTHLHTAGPKLPAVGKLPKLRELHFEFDCEEAPDLSALARAEALRVLGLYDCPAATDLTQLSRRRRLRGLVLGGEFGPLRSFAPFAGLGELRSLVIIGGDNLRDISEAPKLGKLTQLALFPLPDEVDLAPLKRMKHLKILAVPDESLEQRKAEYDEVREAVPDLQIVGICMGSAWVLLLLPAAGAAALLRRRRRAA